MKTMQSPWLAIRGCLLSMGLSFVSPSIALSDSPQRPNVAGLIEHAAEHPDGKMPFSFDVSAYHRDMKPLPIGVFDSGIGGLTVLEAILVLDAFDNQSLRPGADGRRDFENESFVYFGDQANMPYGNYAAAGKEGYLKELILKDTAFLLGRRYWKTADELHPSFDKPPVKAIVIACNTATAYGLDEVRAAVKAWKIPVVVVGVVEAGARGVAESISANEPPRTIAVLATVGTCASMAYPKAIGRATGIAGKRSPHVIQQGSFALAGAIEGDPVFLSPADASIADDRGARAATDSTTRENVAASAPGNTSDRDRINQLYGFDTDSVIGQLDDATSLRLASTQDYVNYDVAKLLTDYRRAGGTQPITTVVLGCTHFPLVTEEIVASFARLRRLKWEGESERPFHALIAAELEVINPAELTAKELFRSLAFAGLRHNQPSTDDRTTDAFFISVPAADGPGVPLQSDGSFRTSYKYGRSTGQFAVEDTRVVPLVPGMLPDASRRLIQTRLPNVWQRLE